MEFFKCFFPDELFEFVTEESNRYGLLKYHFPLPTRWEETNTSEIRQYFGIRIYMSLVQLPNLKMYWQQDELYGGQRIQIATMVYSIFIFHLMQIIFQPYKET